MSKIKKFRFGHRWRTQRKTGMYWCPSALQTNSLKDAKQWAKDCKDDITQQIWDYKLKCSIVG